MATAVNIRNQAVVHVRFAGRSTDVSMPMLGIGSSWQDEQIKHTLAVYLEVPQLALKDYVVDRHPNGNITVRPEAVFG